MESHGWTLAPGLFVTLEVADTGCGMSPETRRRLFDPFFTTKFSGRGLGLSAMLGILKGHRAGIRIRSRGGRGLLVQTLLPGQRHRRPAPSRRRPRPDGAPSTGSILLVDDEPDILEATTELLGLHGLQCGPGPGRAGGGGPVPGQPREPSPWCSWTSPCPAWTAARPPRPDAALDPGLKVVLCSGFNETDVTKDSPYPVPGRLPAEALHLPDAEGSHRPGPQANPWGEPGRTRTPTSWPRWWSWRSVRCSWRR